MTNLDVMVCIRGCMERNKQRFNVMCAHTVGDMDYDFALMQRWFEDRHYALWEEFCRRCDAEPTIEDKAFFQQFWAMPWIKVKPGLPPR